MAADLGSQTSLTIFEVILRKLTSGNYAKEVFQHFDKFFFLGDKLN